MRAKRQRRVSTWTHRMVPMYVWISIFMRTWLSSKFWFENKSGVSSAACQLQILLRSLPRWDSSAPTSRMILATSSMPRTTLRPTAARKPYGLPEPSALRPASTDVIAWVALSGTVVGRKAGGPGRSDCSEGELDMLTPLAAAAACETLEAGVSNRWDRRLPECFGLFVLTAAPFQTR